MLIHPLPPQLGFCVLVPEFLSPAECELFIARSEARGFDSANTDYPPSYRNNERFVIDDAELAHRMTQRLREHLPAKRFIDDVRWTLDTVNERFRFCRYRESQAFHIHQDGVHHRSPDQRSHLTFMIYLTDGEAFEGGDTLFFEGGPCTANAGEAHPPVVARVRPRAGCLIVFDHKIWHAGDVVTRGVKHIMRSDLLYRCEEAPKAPNAPFEPSHAGYVWTLCALSDKVLASGGRDAAIRLWTSDGRPLGRLLGHEQSVLGLAALNDGRLASVSRDRSLRIWNLATKACERVAKPHNGAILCVAALNGCVVTGSADGDIRITDVDTLEQTTLAHGLGWVWAMAVSRDGMLAAASEDGRIRCWDARRMKPMAGIDGDVPLRAVALSEDGLRLAAGDIEGRVTLWSCRGSQWVPDAAWRAHTAAVRKLRFAGDGTLLSGGEDGLAKRWRVADGALLWRAEHQNFVTDVLPLGKHAVLSCAYDGRITQHPL